MISENNPTDERSSVTQDLVRQFLLARQSEPQLTAPAPEFSELEHMMSAVVRSPDHANLKPYRFMALTGQALVDLGELFLDIEQTSEQTSEQASEPTGKQSGAEAIEVSEAKADKIRRMPLRAPMIVVGIVRICEHAKVPAIEQWLAAGCAVQTLSLMLECAGYGVMWRTGKYAHDRLIADRLGLDSDESICAWLYCGTISLAKRNRPEPPPLRQLLSFHDTLKTTSSR